jgi:hypothetical protein
MTSVSRTSARFRGLPRHVILIGFPVPAVPGSMPRGQPLVGVLTRLASNRAHPAQAAPIAPHRGTQSPAPPPIRRDRCRGRRPRSRRRQILRTARGAGTAACWDYLPARRFNRAAISSRRRGTARTKIVLDVDHNRDLGCTDCDRARHRPRLTRTPRSSPPPPANCRAVPPCRRRSGHAFRSPRRTPQPSGRKIR